MATWSVFFTDSTVPGPQVGDGRPYTAAEWRLLYRYLWARGNADRGVLKGVLNACAVTVLGANSLQVNTGLIMVNGGIVVMEAAETLAPASAAAGQTRKDSVIAQLDLDGSGATDQYTVRVITKAGTAGAYPALTQNAATVWEQRLYNYIIDDAGAITSLSDQRQYLTPAGVSDHGDLAGLLDDDHTQYMDVAGVRHTKAAHDALNIDSDTVDGYHAADFLSGVAVGFLGCTVMWGGTIGGSDGHRPIVGGAAREDWHIANGQTVNGVVTLDMTDRVPIGAGNLYAVNAAGGAATVNLQHNHAEGSLAAAAENGHTHGFGNYSTNVVPNHHHANWFYDTPPAIGYFHTIYYNPGATSLTYLGDHNHLVSGDTGDAGTHSHAIASGNSSAGTGHTHGLSGNTANSLSASQSILPPYRGVYFIVYVG